MAQVRDFPRTSIELDPLSYGPKRVVRDVAGMEVYSAEFSQGYGASVGSAVFTLYGSIDGVTKGATLGTIAASAMPYTFPEISVLRFNKVIIERTTSGTSGVVWIQDTARSQ